MDFTLIKHNLYNFLGVPENSDKREIKRAYRGLILKYHPDKNNGVLDDEIYEHIKYINMILLDDKKRELYDDHLLNESSNDFFKLKNNKDDNKITKSKGEALNDYLEAELKLKILHGEYEPNETTMERYNNYKHEEINMDDNDYRRIGDDNDKFNMEFSNKVLNKSSTELISVNNGEISEAYKKNDLSLSNYGKLYGEGRNTSTYTSLDSAFRVMPSVDNLKDREYSRLKNNK